MSERKRGEEEEEGEKRGEIRLEAQKRGEDRGEGEHRETSFVFFSFASCNCNYVGSDCVMVVVMLSVAEREIRILKPLWAEDWGK